MFAHTIKLDTLMEPYPEPGPADCIHTLLKFFISLPPGIGAGLSTFYDLAVPSPVSKRRDAWLKKVADAVNTLVEKNNQITIDTLSADPEFVSFMLEASQIAFKNHQEEKLMALQNAITNFYSEPLYDKKASIINVIDNLTSTHLLIFDLIVANIEIINTQIEGYSKLFDWYLETGIAMPFGFFRKCIQDLDRHGLLRISDDFIDPYAGEGYFENDNGADNLQILEFGYEFLNFIKVAL